MMLRRTLLVTACLTPLAGSEIQAQPGFPGWVGLYTREHLGRLENENRIDELCASSADRGACHTAVLMPAVEAYPLYADPDATSLRIGDLVVVAVPGRGLTAHFRARDSTTSVLFEPDLYLQDWGYGPYFHQTMTQQEGDWFRLPADPWGTPVWLQRRRETGRPSVLYIQAGDIVELEGRGWYVVAADGEGLLVRAEQPADHWCEAGEAPALTPDEPTRYARAELVDAGGRLIVRPKYLKGC